jgi:hypothetical protein
MVWRNLGTEAASGNSVSRKITFPERKGRFINADLDVPHGNRWALTPAMAARGYGTAQRIPFRGLMSDEPRESEYGVPKQQGT